MRGQPLMPCSPAKARHLLKANKATVKRRTPFTIQLSIATGETKQVHLYADVEAANGGEVDTDYRVNFGVRLSY